MDFPSNTSIFNINFNSREYEQELQVVEISTNRALQRINLLYEEIMSPRDTQFEEINVVRNHPCEEQSNHSPKNQTQYFKTCCTSLQELCTKCESYISRCSSCNQCSCLHLEDKKHKKGKPSNSREALGKNSHKSSHNAIVKCTKPQPFSFIDKDYEWLKVREHKIAKLKEDLENKIENELKVKVHTKPVPKTTNLPLYSQMVQDKENRKAIRKEKCLEILSNTKPFNLHSKSKETSKSSTELSAERFSTFKAKPVPKNILSSKISEKLKNKEEIRKMLMVDRAQQLKEQSSSPFSQRTIPRSRSMVDVNSFTKSNNKEYSKKNISEITKRLYVKKCNETMNSWNEKVSQVNTCQTLPNQNFLQKDIKNKVPTSEPMPFLYFPVRMSNAALLRDKQIR